jgi:hypothetical protein
MGQEKNGGEVKRGEEVGKEGYRHLTLSNNALLLTPA